MSSSRISDDQRQSPPDAAREPGPWVVELKIAGCTIRRRAARRRHLLGIGDLVPASTA